MKSTRRQFLSRAAKAGLAVLAGVLGGVGLANRPRPTQGVPADAGFTAEGGVRADGWDLDMNTPPATWRVRTINDEWVHVPLGELHTDVFFPIGWEDDQC